MEIDKDTIKLYLDEATIKISMLKIDITTFQYRITQAEKEIHTMHFLIDQYKKALEVLEENAHT